MKTNQVNFIILLLVFVFPVQSFCQSDHIIVDSKEYRYLIGKEYSDVSELGDFKLEARLAKKYPSGDEICSANLVKGEKQIITSEKAVYDKIIGSEIYEILDIIVLNGHYSVCGGCFLSKKEKHNIVSIHRNGSTSTDSVLVAFERNRRTGKYKQVIPAKLKLNPKKITQH